MRIMCLTLFRVSLSGCYIPIALIVLLAFGKWGYGCYSRITNDAKKILQELEDDNK